jgi:copper chaperone
MAELTMTVQGMTCEHCVHAVTSAVTEVSGVDAADVDLETGRVAVSGSDIDEAAVRAAIIDAGYAPDA